MKKFSLAILFFATNLQAQEPALIDIRLPENAIVLINGYQMKSTGPQRTYRTPPIQFGITYYYMMTINFEQDGQVFQQTRKVECIAGQITLITFAEIIVPGPGAPKKKVPEKKS